MPRTPTIGADVFVAHGPFGEKPEPSTDLHGHILTNVLCNDPAREAEWDAWYDEQHVPDMLSCGAFGAMSRWERTPRSRDGANFLTLYDVATDTVEEAVERSAVTLGRDRGRRPQARDARGSLDGDAAPDRPTRWRRLPPREEPQS